MRRADVVFVAVVFTAAIVVYLVALTVFTANPFVWTVQHPDYAASALLPVLPLAVLARIVLRGGRALPVPTTDEDEDEDAVAPAVAPAVEPGIEPGVEPGIEPGVEYSAEAVAVDDVEEEVPPSQEVPPAGEDPEREPVVEPQPPTPPPAPVEQFDSVEQLAVASVLDRGKSVAEVARTLKVRPATVQMWVARSRDRPRDQR